MLNAIGKKIFITLRKIQLHRYEVFIITEMTILLFLFEVKSIKFYFPISVISPKEMYKSGYYVY